MPTEIWQNIKNRIKDQFALFMNYKKFHKENIPDQIKNAKTVQFLEIPIRNNLDFTEQWWIKKN